MMSSAMLRGRADFFSLVIGLLRVVGQDDRTLPAISVLDVRAGQMQRTDNRLAGIGAYLLERALQPLASRSEAPKRIVNPGAPVGAGDEFARYRDTVSRQPRLMQP